MNDETKNLILALVISLSVVFAWQYFFVKPYQEEVTRIEMEEKAKAQIVPSETEGAPSINAATSAINTQQLTEDGKLIYPTRDEIIKQDTAKRVTITTNELTGSFSLKGLRFDDLKLHNYNVELNDESKKVVLLSPYGAERMYFAEFGWTSAKKGIDLPNKNTVWASDKDTLTVDSPITLRWTSGQNITFTRTIEVDEHFMFTIKDDVHNNSDNEIKLANYAYIERTRPEKMSYYISHEGLLGVFENKLTEISYDNLHDEVDGAWSASSTNAWTAMTDKYWLTALIPNQEALYRYTYKYRMINGLHRYHADYISPTNIIAQGESLSATHHFFAGAKKVKLLDEYGTNLDLRLFDRAVDFGRLYFITKPFYSLIMLCQGLLSNFGLAILLMTFIVKLAMFPLANKSYRSLAGMKKFAPELESIKERAAGDKSKMQQELMKFYKENSINPLSGCWPMLIQIPIFFALYKVLFVTIEMRHAPFYGWIHDLSAPDPLNILTGFGLIEWNAPIVIGLLPILFTLSMVIQQKLNPPPTDPTQAMIIKWMPYLFLFLFASFPAGLVLYWTMSNVLSIIQQYHITRSIQRQDSRSATVMKE